MKETIRKLVESWGPSGFEHHVRETIKAEIEGLADEIKVDPLGNLIARMGSGGTKVMVDAHMDEIGIMISHVDKDGYLRFTNIGGVRVLTLMGNRVKFEDGTIGSIGVDGGWDRTTMPKITDFYVDVSTGGESNIGVGSPAIFWRTMVERGDVLVAKSFDDRIGCAMMIEAMRQLKNSPHEVYFVFAVQEEVGLRGTRPAAFGIEPDVGIALDVTGSGDQPKGEKIALKLGKGTAIKVQDRGHIVPPKMKDLMVARAEEAGIPYQLEVLPLGTTDAAGIQISRGGIPSGVISVPTRYIHTTSETLHYGDVEASVKLLVEMLSKPIEL